jgi:hypothetical protein
MHAAQQTHGVSSVAFSRDGTEFAAGDHAGSTFVWHLQLAGLSRPRRGDML